MAPIAMFFCCEIFVIVWKNGKHTIIIMVLQKTSNAKENLCLTLKQNKCLKR